MVAPLKYQDQKHTPFVAGDSVDAQFLPISERSNNELQILSDGLYVGQGLTQSIFYVGPSGTNAPTSGSKVTPFLTLDYALSQLSAQSVGGVFTGKATIALQAAETFTVGADFINGGDLQIAFFGSSFGDFDSPSVQKARPAVIAELERPIINISSGLVNGLWQSFGIRCNDGAKVQLTGVYINVPAIPANEPNDDTYSGYSDFITAINDGTVDVSLLGTIINSHNGGRFGFLGVHARAEAKLRQFASQFLVDGAKAVAGSAPFVLQARTYFIKFYNDYSGSNQEALNLEPTSASSSAGTGILTVNWSDTQAQLIQTGANSLDSYPVMFDPSAGLRNYFWNLVRDTQQRPMNVISGRLM